MTPKLSVHVVGLGNRMQWLHTVSRTQQSKENVMHVQRKAIVLEIAQLVRDHGDPRAYLASRGYLKAPGGEHIAKRHLDIIHAAVSENQAVAAVAAHMLLTDGLRHLRTAYATLDIRNLNFNYLGEKSEEELGRFEVFFHGPEAVSVRDSVSAPVNLDDVEAAILVVARSRIESAKQMFAEAEKLLATLTAESTPA